MSILLGCIADDSTGASDLANTLTRNGLRTIQVQGTPTPDLNLPDVDAVVIALKTRSIAADQAVALSLEASDWLVEHGAAHVMFKICSTFDSTDQGNIGPVIDALRTRHGGAIMPVTPAFPATGRTVYKGYLFVEGALLSESPLRDHPLNPMHEPNLVRALQRQSRSPVGLADFAVVDAGPDALCAAIDGLAQAGTGSVIVDAISERHLETLGIAALKGPISTGASGFGLGLARRLVAEGRSPGVPQTAKAGAAQGKAAMIAGSCSHATLAQIAEAERHYPVLRIEPEELLADAVASVGAALAWAAPYLDQDRPFLITTSADRASVEAVQSAHGLEHTAYAIEDALASIAAELAARGVRRLVVAGGETSGAIVGRLGIRAFLIGVEVAPGVPVVHAQATKDAMSLVLKSGNFGAPTFFADALRAMDQ